MKPAILLSLLVASVTAYTQNVQLLSRKGYIRLGVNIIGRQLQHSRSPEDNVKSGRIGTGAGAVLETGRVFYFGENTGQLLNYGLDWTYISATCNTMHPWDKYADAHGNAGAVENKIAASLATKLGPVVSANLTDDLVIDLRGQAGVAGHYFGVKYDAGADYIRFVRANGKRTLLDDFSSSMYFDAGITVRRKAIGLSFDYQPGNIYLKYSVPGTEPGRKPEAINISGMQLKISWMW